MDFSIVVPIFNEEDNIPALYQTITSALDGIGSDYEIILVDDGSIDGSFSALKSIAAQDPRVKVIRFRRNFGQTAAMSAGFDAAAGEIIIPMDGDLQNDPADIPRLIAKLNEGYDVVSGWRSDRKDTFITRKIPSMLANALISSSETHRRKHLAQAFCAFRVLIADHHHLRTFMGVEIANDVWSPIAVTNHTNTNHRAFTFWDVRITAWSDPGGADQFQIAGKLRYLEQSFSPSTEKSR